MLGFTRQAGGANLLVALGAVLLLASVHSACAAPPQTILICVSGATFADLQAGGRLPDVRRLAEDGGVALLHNSVWGDFNTNAAFLSVGASERMAAPATGNVSPAFLREYQAKVANRAAKVTAFADALHTVGVSFRGSETAPGSLVLRGTQTGSENVRVVYYRDMGAANEHAVRLLRGKRNKHVAWYFVAPDTPPIPGGAPYRHLGFVVAFGDGVLPG